MIVRTLFSFKSKSQKILFNSVKSKAILRISTETIIIQKALKLQGIMDL